MNGLHKNFSPQGHDTSEVKAAIFVSDNPRLLYIRTATTLVATKGSPSAT